MCITAVSRGRRVWVTEPRRDSQTSEADVASYPHSVLTGGRGNPDLLQTSDTEPAGCQMDSGRTKHDWRTNNIALIVCAAPSAALIFQVNIKSNNTDPEKLGFCFRQSSTSGSISASTLTIMMSVKVTCEVTSHR